MATVQGVYLALFGRPADPGGLTYFNGITASGANLAPILGTLAATAEYKSRFSGMENDRVVNEIFRSLFNRNADQAGASFFANELSSGRQTIETIAVNILDGATGADRTTADKKLAAAAAYTDALNTSPGALANYTGSTGETQGRDYLRMIDANSPSPPDPGKLSNAITDLQINMGGDDTVVHTRNGPELNASNPSLTRAEVLHILPGDSGLTDANRDVIKGFQSGIDSITFEISGGAGSAVNFRSLSSSFSDAATANVAADEALDGKVLYVLASVGADKFLFVDSNGDGSADISAKLVGQVEFSMYDII
ncbi:DUF4214 domain-containing protein [Rhizobium sp. LjRoot30]|uniref:DUF4214 domain-containing protein n=1 Tax=Rhizobium sp. LjRoot30 TaxID=3342320 RepID=UPI003ECCBC0C